MFLAIEVTVVEVFFLSDGGKGGLDVVTGQSS